MISLLNRSDFSTYYPLADFFYTSSPGKFVFFGLDPLVPNERNTSTTDLRIILLNFEVRLPGDGQRERGMLGGGGTQGWEMGYL